LPTSPRYGALPHSIRGWLPPRLCQTESHRKYTIRMAYVALLVLSPATLQNLSDLPGTPPWPDIRTAPRLELAPSSRPIASEAAGIANEMSLGARPQHRGFKRCPRRPAPQTSRHTPKRD